jgi:hypothetical protein
MADVGILAKLASFGVLPSRQHVNYDTEAQLPTHAISCCGVKSTTSDRAKATVRLLEPSYSRSYHTHVADSKIVSCFVRMTYPETADFGQQGFRTRPTLCRVELD